MKTIVIDRAQWLLPTDAVQNIQNSCLLDSDGKMCCLGFVALQLAGAEKKHILHYGSPASTPWLAWPQVLKPYLTDAPNSPLATALMAINDNVAVSREEREFAIGNKFREAGIEVEFEGSFPEL